MALTQGSSISSPLRGTLSLWGLVLNVNLLQPRITWEPRNYLDQIGLWACRIFLACWFRWEDLPWLWAPYFMVSDCSTLKKPSWGEAPNEHHVASVSLCAWLGMSHVMWLAAEFLPYLTHPQWWIVAWNGEANKLSSPKLHLVRLLFCSNRKLEQPPTPLVSSTYHILQASCGMYQTYQIFTC